MEKDECARLSEWALTHLQPDSAPVDEEKRARLGMYIQTEHYVLNDDIAWCRRRIAQEQTI